MAGVFVHLSHALLLWALFQWHEVQSHKILILPMYGNSHYFVMRKIAGELAQRDNEVNDLQWPETNAISFFSGSERDKWVSIPKRLFSIRCFVSHTRRGIPFWFPRNYLTCIATSRRNQIFPVCGNITHSRVYMLIYCEILCIYL